VRLSEPKTRGHFGKGIDPKDRIRTFESYHELLDEIGSRKIEPAMPKRISALRKMAPELRGLEFLEAQVFDALRRTSDALQKYNQGLDIEPGDSIARANYANLLLRMRRTSEAEREFLRLP